MRSMKPKKILLIESDNFQIDLFNRIVKKQYNVDVEISNEKTLFGSLKALKAETYDAIVVDTALPDSTGLTVIEEIYQAAKATPIVVLTGAGDDDIGLKAVKMGAQDYIIKSLIAPTSLIRSINYAIIRKRIENTLIQTAKDEKENSESKSLFLANMSHEIRTPLNTIMNMTEMIQVENKQEHLTEYLDVLNRSSNALISLVDDILDISKVEGGFMELENRTCDLPNLIKSSAKIIEYRAKDKGLSLSFDLDPFTELIIVDPSKLQQVLLNIMNNAIKFTQQGGIILKAWRQKSECLISIKDTGPGISKDNLGKIFNKYSQETSSIKRKFGGTGLGLAISKQLIELMGGTITVTSTLGEGTEFVITFPFNRSFSQEKAHTKPILKAAQPTKDLPPSSDSPQIHQVTIDPLCPPDTPDIDQITINDQKKQPQVQERLSRTSDTIEFNQTINDEESQKNILIVDDSKDNQFVIKVLLKSTSYNLSYSDNGEEAYQAFRNNHFDLILMDLQMPVLDGHEATKKIRAYEKDTNQDPITIIAATASVMFKDKKKALASGCDDVITKPLKKVILLEMLKSKLNNKTILQNVIPIAENNSNTNDDLNFSTEDFNQDLSEYLQTYISHRYEDLNLLEDILSKHSTKGINEICHRVLGSAETYGLKKLASVFTKLHKASKTDDFDKAKAYVQDIKVYLGTAEYHFCSLANQVA